MKRSVLIPFEIREKEEIKRDDLPRFEAPWEVIDFMNRHLEIHTRDGFFVQIEWRDHDEPWAIEEFENGLGSGYTTPKPRKPS